MSEWNTVTLQDITSILGDGLHGTPKYSEDGDYYFINGNNLRAGNIVITDKTKKCTLKEYEKYKKNLNNRTILVSINGTIGNIALYNGEKCFLGKSACYFNINEDVDKLFVYYVLKDVQFQNYAMNFANGTTIKNVPLSAMRNFTFNLPPLPTQRKIAAILSSLDDKIENNRKACEKLEEIAQAIFKRWFVDFEFPNKEGKPYKSSGGKMVESELGLIPEGWKVKEAQEFYDITIGKTPPRKQSQWFEEKKSEQNIKWVSIKDMGNANTFIHNTSECLTNESVEKFNVKVVNRNVVLLSFKLTIGRVSITTEKMVTNEAIAHFVFDNEEIGLREYTYLMLKNYNYAELGSTSSIATAINSRIIKGMNILIPNDDIIRLFGETIKSKFDLILHYQKEIKVLRDTRNILLQKLMNGDIEVK